MRIQHNIAALNSYRNLTNNNSAVAKNLEKLSSGYRINRAGDDAAGLAISEKMRAQITGLETAQKNANDGISLVQTAEGALTEVHSMLNRMVELANQSANGTYDNDVDRANLQKEVDSLMDEIDRISKGTNFNGINLLDGTYASTSDKVTMSESNGIKVLNQTTGTIAGSSTILHKDGKAAQDPQFSIDFSTVKVSGGSTGDTMKINIGGEDITVTMTGPNMTSSDVAQAVADAINNTANATISVVNTAGAVVTDTVNGIQIGGTDNKTGAIYKAEVKGDKVVFTLAESEKGYKQALTSDMDLIPDGKVILDPTDNANKNYTFTSSLNTGFQEVREGIVNDGTQYANAEFNLTFNMIKDGTQLTIGNETYTFRVGSDSFVSAKGKNVVDLSDFDLEADDFDQLKFMETVASRLSETAANNDMFTVGVSNDGGPGVGVTEDEVTIGIREKATYSGDADLASVKGIEAQLSYKTVTDKPAAEDSKGLTLQIGDTSDSFNKLSLNIAATNAKSLGIADINIGTQEGAAAAVDKIKAAINKVSSIRGDLGAIQNRLEHTINNLSVTAENMTAAESRIRDVDMAKEMMAYTKNNILVQASQAMLAQANQVPQGVLQLLQ